jgi:mono/diheme cytochrome c family protein
MRRITQITKSVQPSVFGGEAVLLRPFITNFHARTPNMLLLTVACLIGLVAASRPSAAGENEGAITTGSEQNALAYYADISGKLGFPLTVGATSLDELLVFTGYPTSAAQLEALDSSVLNDPGQASSCPGGLCLAEHGLGAAELRTGDILATRFFAPKIVNINTTVPQPGWRKLVRLRARPDSAAARAGVENVIILFNSFADAAQVPFPSHSVNTQVMLLAPARQRGLMWLDFDKDGKLGTALNASFDAADLPSSTGGTRSYFVPDGCNACHESPGNARPPLVNYLDTDHWFDRLTTDFPALRDAGTALLFDAKSNEPSSATFVKAFDVIRQFNEEALRQNSVSQPDSFEAQAARTWLRVHSDSAAHVAPVGRGFTSTAGAPPWQPSEAGGLDMLNQFCFRCHGSVLFSVFDRAAVVERAGNMRQRIHPSHVQARVPGFKMPPDRSLEKTLSPAQIEQLDTFLRGLK